MAKWMIKNIKCDIKKLSKLSGESEFITKLLVNRGISTPEEIHSFINGSLDDLHSPYEMKDMEKSVDIIIDKINAKSKILIVGDYDVDGIMSAFMLYKALIRCKADVEYYIPDRITEGYGINIKIIDNAKENGFDTLITCDNGIAAIDQIKHAKDIGISVVVTDHHNISFIENNGSRQFVLPEALAVVNPKQVDCNYPFKNLCGAVIVFKFVQVLYEKMRIDKKEVFKFIQYAAMATICDVVNLTDENRVIVKYGLKQLENTDNVGLKQLIKVVGLNDKPITVYSVGFVLGPCFNATGRLEHAKISVELLMTEDIEKAKLLAEKLHELNVERQEMTSLGVEKALEISEELISQGNKILVPYIPDVHESIAGIVAGRVREKYNLPTIVLTNAHDGVKGSGRSIEAYNMFEGLLQCKELLTKFGGHPMAAGVSLNREDIESFRNKLNDNCKLSQEDVIPKVVIDMQMPFNKVNMAVAESLRTLEPYGVGNTRPIFAEKKVHVLKAFLLGKNQNVLRLTLRSSGIVQNAIMFDKIKEFKDFIVSTYGQEEMDKLFNGGASSIVIDIVYNIGINQYNNNTYLQLQILDFR